MSGLLAGKVWQSSLDGTLKPLAACLADIANDDGTRIFPSHEYICWLMGKSSRAIQYQLRALEEKGIIELVVEAGGKTGAFREYRMNEAKLPRRKKWALGAKSAPSKPGAKKDQLGATLDEPGAIPDISPYRDPSLDPSIPAARSRAQGKPEPPHSHTDDPNGAIKKELVDFLVEKLGPLSAYGPQVKALNWMVEQNYSADQMRRCWSYLDSQTWRGCAVTWLTVKKEIGAWVRHGEILAEASRNGNGHRPSRVDISLQATRELLAEAEAERNANAR